MRTAVTIEPSTVGIQIESAAVDGRYAIRLAT
jgi:hypothetical protein